ncbi:putative hydrolase, CocE/NonD family [Saccharomonospora marina XMU15]|uniref:Putative hydrolase, CocE/NonD family n=1 Tax=Saccharomonospora marina XMU15 TaxID=882083 RepID=H5WYP7_9PSEU|nr:CocE/NonD family hydrolase [Saccharomonospora marina]EHR50712.1 putative hydrolase, CocE/NonD family [Saccharomonospora marina XMU15]
MTATRQDPHARMLEQVEAPMRDGVQLSGTLYRATAEPRPVLLVRTPYSEPMSRSLPVLPALDSGFAVLVQSCRGTGRSGGKLRTFESEEADGLDTVEWLRRQPWCDGRVAMFGMSYLGMTQLAIAGHRPDGLVAIAPTVTPDDYRDGLVYRQGAFQLGQALGWHLLKAAQSLGDAAARGEDVRAELARLGELAADTEAACRKLPLSDRPGIVDVLPSWRAWLERENDSGYWHDLSYAHRRAAVSVPGLHVGGWFDLFLRGTLDNYTTLAGSGTANQHLIVGPWSHADQSGIAGEVYYHGGSAQAARLEEQQLRFLRDSVSESPTSLPPVLIYVMGADRWRTENEWPPARTEWQTWYLAAHGTLSRELPAAGTARYRHDPHDPVPTVGGAILMAGSPDGGLDYQPGSRDQRGLDGRADILRFSSAVLTEDVEVTGPLRVRLFAATSANDTDFTAKLVDIHPDGRAMGIADGIVRARYRAGMDSPMPVVPGETTEYTIDLGATSQVFKAGHRIRVDIASSNFPCFDRNCGSGKPAGQVTEADFVTARQRICFGPRHPSAIQLPVIPTDR